MTRRFSLIDAMALIVAVGVGFAVVREWAAPGFTASNVTLFGRLQSILAVLTSVCVYTALVVIVLGIRRPRPPIRMVCRQPGMAACLALAIAWLVSLEESAAVVIPLRRRPAIFWPELADVVLAASTSVHRLAPSIAVAWAILALSGRWRADRGWIDRLGRSIGVTLLGIHAFQSIRMYLFAIL